MRFMKNFVPSAKNIFLVIVFLSVNYGAFSKTFPAPESGFVSIDGYVQFLNEVAVESDLHHLYQPTSLITRSGGPGNYHYEAPNEKKEELITLINWCDAARYCHWLENTASANNLNFKIDPSILTEHGLDEFDDDHLVGIKTEGVATLPSSLYQLKQETFSAPSVAALNFWGEANIDSLAAMPLYHLPDSVSYVDPAIHSNHTGLYRSHREEGVACESSSEAITGSLWIDRMAVVAFLLGSIQGARSLFSSCNDAAQEPSGSAMTRRRGHLPETFHARSKISSNDRPYFLRLQSNLEQALKDAETLSLKSPRGSEDIASESSENLSSLTTSIASASLDEGPRNETPSPLWTFAETQEKEAALSKLLQKAKRTLMQQDWSICSQQANALESYYQQKIENKKGLKTFKEDCERRSNSLSSSQHLTSLMEFALLEDQESLEKWRMITAYCNANTQLFFYRDKALLSGEQEHYEHALQALSEAEQFHQEEVPDCCSFHLPPLKTYLKLKMEELVMNSVEKAKALCDGYQKFYNKYEKEFATYCSIERKIQSRTESAPSFEDDSMSSLQFEFEDPSPEQEKTSSLASEEPSIKELLEAIFTRLVEAATPFEKKETQGSY